MSHIVFPLQFKRQYSGPVDADTVFETYTEMQSYLTNPARYAGQLVVCKEYNDEIYVLNNAKDTWLQIDKYTQSEVDGFLANKSDNTHNHDAVYPVLDGEGLIPVTYIPQEYKESKVVADVATRDALTDVYEGLRVHVIDASADTTVESGGAGYIYYNTSWTKTYEEEQLDVVTNWADVQNKPELYTQTEVDGFLSNKSDTNHIHDSRYPILDGSSLIPSSYIPNEFKESKVVVDIPARDALTDVYEGLRIHVVDASADTTVNSGGAGYIYHNSVWHKTYEEENLDTLVNWTDVQNKPALYSQTEIDGFLVNKSDSTHNHDTVYPVLDGEGLIPVTYIPQEYKESKVVNNITARNSLTDVYEGLRVHVVDASADATVDSGGAGYIYHNTSWIKTYEEESLDTSIDWTDVQNKPLVYSQTEIDDFLSNKSDDIHSHTESEITDLDKYTQVQVDDLFNQKVNVPVTKQIYVDKSRSDTYTETGSILYPFKALQSALDVASSGSLIKLFQATYTEDVIIPEGVSLEGMDRDSTIIDGNITTTAGQRISLRYIQAAGTNKVLEINTPCTLIDCYVSSRMVLNTPANVKAFGTFVVASQDVVALTNNSTGGIEFFGATIRSSGNTSNVIEQNAGLVYMSASSLIGSSSDSCVKTIGGGSFIASDSYVINELGNNSIDLSNSSVASGYVSTLSGVVATGNVVCSDKTVNIDGVSFQTTGQLSGTQLILRDDTQINNSSTVSGSTVKNALDQLDIQKADNQDLHGHQTTRIVYVDAHRVDSYTENGSVANPFKTIQAAVDYVASLAPSNHYSIHINSGHYDESVSLENNNLKWIKLVGNGYPVIEPSAGNAIQSIANNDNLERLHLQDLIIAKPIVIEGSEGTTAFGDVVFSNVSINATSGLTATCINNIGIRDSYVAANITYVNVNYSYMESNQQQGALNITMDDTQKLPDWGKDGAVIANGIYQSGDITYTINGAATYTVVPQGSRWGTGNVSVPAGISYFAYNSYLRGIHTNAGDITLRNSTIQEYVADGGTLTIDGNPSNQVKNNSTVTGNSVTDALESLNTNKSETTHTHTETDITNLDKYTQTEIDGFLANKSDTGHTHADTDISNNSTVTGATVSDALNTLKQMAYTPTTDGDWNTVPLNVADALDELASRITALEV